MLKPDNETPKASENGLNSLDKLYYGMKTAYTNIKDSISKFEEKMKKNKNKYKKSFEFCLRFHFSSIGRFFSIIDKNMEGFKLLYSKSEELITKNDLIIKFENPAEEEYNTKNKIRMQIFSEKLKELDVEIGLLKNSYVVNAITFRKDIRVSAHLKTIFKEKYREVVNYKYFPSRKTTLYPEPKVREIVYRLHTSIKTLSEWLNFMREQNGGNYIIESINMIINTANLLINESRAEYPNFDQLNKKIDTFYQHCNEIYPIIKEVYFLTSNDKNR